MAEHRIFSTAFGAVYPHYVAKAERKDRTKAEVDEILTWLTGYDPAALQARIADGTDVRAFSPRPRPSTPPARPSPA